MKKPLLLAFTLLFSMGAFSQSILGRWYGVIKVQNQDLRIVFEISKQDTALVATMDSPDQGAKGIKVDKVSYSDDSILRLEITNANIEYSGVYTKDRIIGTFKQGDFSFPVNLSKRVIAGPDRPQEPKPPYGYYTEEISFKNKKADISLSGTLSLPSKTGKYPVVILISGSGPQDRNEEILGHKPFLVIADYLTKNGIGVFRYDDRGVGKSEGNYATATTMDFADDAEAAVDYLKTRNEVKSGMIGLIGHSEGGIIAPIIAARRDDIAFIVLLAAPGVKGSEIILSQQEILAKASGLPEDEMIQFKKLNQDIFNKIEKYPNDPELKNMIVSMILTASKGEISAVSAKQQAGQFTTPWMIFFLSYDPSVSLIKVKCPILAINGSKDTQVQSKTNLEAIKKCLTEINNNVSIIEIEGLNHLFQESETGLPSEYSKNTETFSNKALLIILEWIQKHSL